MEVLFSAQLAILLCFINGVFWDVFALRIGFFDVVGLHFTDSLRMFGVDASVNVDQNSHYVLIILRLFVILVDIFRNFRGKNSFLSSWR